MKFFTPKEQNSACYTNPDSNGHDCCTPQPKGKAPCPECTHLGKGVLAKTLESLLTDAAKAPVSCLEGFHYCTTPTCKVVYFRNDQIFTQKDMTVPVGLKEGAKPATVCYCFDWTKEKIRVDLQEHTEK